MSSTTLIEPCAPAVKPQPADEAEATPAPEREMIESITHGIGVVLSLVGAIALLVTASSRGDGWYLAACVIYAATLVCLYAASTASHWFYHPPVRRRMRMLDQGAIYLLIAGTFTPFGLVYLREGWWWLLIVVMWTAALAGFVSKVFLAHRLQGVCVWLYVLMGWLPVIAFKPVTSQANMNAVWLMLAGGLCYTFGTFFLVNDNRKPYFHGIWHVCVIGGSALHYLAIFQYVGLPVA